MRKISRRARLSVGRGILRLISDATGIQTAQVSLMANETRSDVERFQEYGFTSVPLPGAEAAIVFVQGSRDHGLIIGVDDKRYRLKGLQGGEVAIYTDEGDFIKLGRGRNIQVETLTLTVTAPDGITLDTSLVKCTGDIIDNFGDNLVTIQEMREIYNTHVHDENDSGGPTDVPNEPM